MENVVKVAGYIPITDELRRDINAGTDLTKFIGDAFDRMLRPWRYPDRNPMPHIDLFPRLTKVERRIRDWRERRQHRWPDDDEDW